MDSNRIMELLARKMANEATTHELEELDELMAIYPDSLHYEEVLKEIWSDSGAEKPSHNLYINRIFEQHKLKFSEEFEPVLLEEEIPSSWYKKYVGVFAIACSLFLICLAALFQLNRKTVDFDTVIVSGKGMRKKITLPDGTLVWLNADSKLSYDSKLNEKGRRLVYLIGEAFFDVAHQKNRTFIVQTNKISIKVLGTAFNVKAYDLDQVSEATLLRGSIELSVNSKSQQKILLKPSEKFALTENKKTKDKKALLQDSDDLTLKIENIAPVRIAGQDYIEETSWKDDVLVFKNESFEELKPKLERWFNVQIEIAANVPKSYRFTGIFKNENIKEALTAMQLIKPFHFKLKADDVIIY
ncbi:FecR domain-containing protein [Pedobacter sp. FW305-3-2-15-E-R2A2]|uniref:FecR family protein n=1 Tax=Pedobacter sp. FW305-3-2-15-E-R2A2 TaxID=3140251 RepID=UPI00314002AF